MDISTTDAVVEIISDNSSATSYGKLSTFRKSTHIISGIRKEIIECFIRLNIFRIIVSNIKNPVNWIRILLKLDQRRRKFSGESRIMKLAKVDGKYHWDLYIPAWPSKAFDEFIKAEINRIVPLKTNTNRFTNIFFAITKKCSLQCEHCFEWEALNKKEKLSADDIHQIINTFQRYGTSQIQITGGEPMLRVKDILNELNSADKKTEFWVLTSGYNFTEENATLLKTAGLKGVVISVDHFDPYRHNVFRGNMNSFKWVEDAVKNASAANLVIAFSICVTREFVSMQNLFAYASLAKNMGAAFIQILEPKPVGHYKDKNVLLEQSQLEVLEAFFWQMNYSGKYTDFPLVNYHGYYQRSTGCFAAGNRNLYVDTDGDLHACPFCHKKTGNVLSSDLAESICKLEKEGCMSFSVADY